MKVISSNGRTDLFSCELNISYTVGSLTNDGSSCFITFLTSLKMPFQNLCN